MIPEFRGPKANLGEVVRRALKFGLTLVPEEDFEKEAAYRGLIPIRASDDGELDLANPDRAAAKLSHRAPRPNPDETLAALEAVVAYFNERQGSPLRSFALTNQYLTRYRKLAGQAPRNVLEVGGNSDLTGQLLACAVHGTVYNGATFTKGPGLQPEVLEPLMRILCLDYNLRAHLGEAIFGVDFTAMEGLDGPYEFIFSHVVLEHVADLPGFFEAAKRRLAPGGTMMSCVDLSDHGHTGHPLDFLRLTEEEWQKNRCSVEHRTRNDDYIRLLEGAGFEVEAEVLVRVDDVPEDIQHMYPGRDLTPITVLYTTRLA